MFSRKGTVINKVIESTVEFEVKDEFLFAVKKSVVSGGLENFFSISRESGACSACS